MRIIDYFDNGAKYYPSQTAFVDLDQGDAATSYAEAHAASHRIAAAIRGKGYGKGAHIGILAPNSTIAFLALLGLFRAEGVWLPINPRNPVPVNADLLVALRRRAAAVPQRVRRRGRASSWPRHRTSARRSASTPRAPDGRRSRNGPRVARETHDVGPEGADDLFAIFPTGGTTGKSKGVMITHRNIETLFANFYAHFRYHDDTRHLVVAPMTHTAGIVGAMHFARGGTNVIMSKASPQAVVDAIEKHRITHLFLPPTVLYMTLALPDIRKRDFSSLQHFLVGAAPTSLEKLKEAIDGVRPGDDRSLRPVGSAGGDHRQGAVGLPRRERQHHRIAPARHRPRLRVTTRSPSSTTTARNSQRVQAGEICVRGALVTPGYYKNPEATAEARKFGWHHTGDVGVMDRDGFITIVDRKKDMIITGGINVSARARRGGADLRPRPSHRGAR